MIQFKKILCPTDFSEPSLEGLRYAIELARTFEAELCLVHISPIFVLPPDGAIGVTPVATGATETLRTESAHRLDELAAQWIPATIRHTQRLGVGAAAPEIVRLAEEENADVIVIATNGETAIWFLGQWRNRPCARRIARC